jgi:hypothetical protein
MRQISSNIVLNRESDGIAIWAKTGPPLVIPKPGSSARNLFAADSEAADSSPDKVAFGMTISRGFLTTEWAGP